MSKLNVPLVETKWGEGYSGAGCAHFAMRNLMRYYKDKIQNINEIVNRMNLFMPGETYTGQMGTYFLEQNYDVKIYLGKDDLFRIPKKTCAKISEEELFGRLETKLKKRATKLEKYIFEGFFTFLKKGGKIEFGEINMNLFRENLERKIPLMALVHSNKYYGMKALDEGHEIIIDGYKNKLFHVVDTYQQNPFSPNGKYWHDANKLINNVRFAGGGVIAATKQKTNSL
jgi:hypothetical protein